MPIEYVCRWCGFILYKGDKPKSAEDVVRQWGGRCPRCLSPISKTPHKIEVLPVRKPLPINSSPVSVRREDNSPPPSEEEFELMH